MKRKPPSSAKSKPTSLTASRQDASSRTKKPVPREVLGSNKPEEEYEDPESQENNPESNEEDSEEGPPESELGESEAQSHLSALPALETESRSLAAHDPLKRYLEEIRKYPLLDPQEEFALAIKLRDESNPAEARLAARALVTANLRLVVKIAFEYRTFYSNILDLVQEGNVGLMKAVSKFDPSKGARLGYYSSWWIRSYILKYLLDNFRLVRIGTTQAQKKLFYHLMREKERLEAQGVFAGPKLLAERLHVKEKDVIEMEQRLSGRGSEMSLETPVYQSEGSPVLHKDLLSDDRQGADDALAQNQLLELLKAKLPEFKNLLSEKELRILQERLLAEEPKTLQEVADLYGLTRERARQIESKVIEKLKEFLKSAFYD